MMAERLRMQIQEELLLAKQSRLEGNEGRARVCARRAAGAAVLQYLEGLGKQVDPDNLFQTLVLFGERDDLPQQIQGAIQNLVKRVDHDHQLPPGADLIQEAITLISYLNKGEIEA